MRLEILMGQLVKSIRKECDNERKLKFEKDKWCSEEFSYISFPSLCTVIKLKEVWLTNL